VFVCTYTYECVIAHVGLCIHCMHASRPVYLEKIFGYGQTYYDILKEPPYKCKCARFDYYSDHGIDAAYF